MTTHTICLFLIVLHQHIHLISCQREGPMFGQIYSGIGDPNIVLFEGRNPFCNGVVIEPHWVVVPAHCIGNREVESLNVGYAGDGTQNWHAMAHYFIQYVVMEQSYLSSLDSRYDYALIRLINELPIPQAHIPVMNALKIPYRPSLHVVGFQFGSSERFLREISQPLTRIYECETARENTNEVDKLICYQFTKEGNLFPNVDGALIVGYDKNKGTNSLWTIYGMHVKYVNLSSWYMRVGRAVNFAGDFWYWLQAVKFERLQKSIPTSKKFFCCEGAVLDRFKQNKQPYKNRRLANIKSQGNPPLC